MHWWNDWGWGHMFGMGLFWLVFVVLIVVLVVWLVRSGGAGGATSREPPAEEILRQRYARGEIDAEEYSERLEELRRN